MEFINLLPRVIAFPGLFSLVLGNGKRRDPGNEIGVYHRKCQQVADQVVVFDSVLSLNQVVTKLFGVFLLIQKAEKMTIRS